MPREEVRFVRTHDSDEWVRQSLKIQPRYTRLLVVSSDGKAPAQLAVPPLDLNLNGGGEEQKYPVHAVFHTLQQAADAAQGGDLVAVLPGHYDGFIIGDKPDARDGAYIHFKAMGLPGEVIIDRPSELKRVGRLRYCGIFLNTAHHVIIQGFRIDGRGTEMTTPGHEYGMGILVSTLFAETGKMSHHLVVTDVYSHDHITWGMLATQMRTVLVQDSLFARSRMEHGLYVSDGSHDVVVRRNVFMDNAGCGCQCNLDPECCFREIATHPLLEEYPPTDFSFAWAKGLFDLAVGKFGEHNFPDGRGMYLLIENNVMNGGGRRGGSGLNLHGVQDSLIQNNLIYGNANHGMALWDSGNRFDRDSILRPLRRAEDFTGPDMLSFWGAQRNLVRNNTILIDNAGRSAIEINNGSWGNKLRNNICINDQEFSLSVTASSLYKFDSGYNVANVVGVVEMSDHCVPAFKIPGGPKLVHESLKTLATNLDERNHTVMAVTRERLAGEFVRYGTGPWAVEDGPWWKLNPDRPDLHPRANSTLLAGKGDPQELPPTDLEGHRRRTADIGAFVASVKA